MNMKLADGSVRCMNHMDASSYVDDVNEPCTYCGEIDKPVHMTCCNTHYATVAESLGHECTKPDHFHVVGVQGFHPNNIWHHHAGDLYTLGGSAYAFFEDMMRPCYSPPQPYGRCMSNLI